MKQCIFYLPYELPERGDGPRSLRPRKLVQAFHDIGYEVFVIWGRCAERKRRIKDLKNSIKNGCRYEFLYAECSTAPMIMTESRRYLTHPFLDFAFFRYAKKQGIPIGLFYSDIHWKFGLFSRKIWWKQFAAQKFYEYDIRQYEKYVDRFYLPSLTLADQIGSEKLKKISALLLPGAENLSVKDKDYTHRNFAEKPLCIFYTGGLREHYRFSALLKAVARTEYCIMILCCRERDWMLEKDKYEPFLSDKIRVIHKYNDELEPYYEEADIGALYYENSGYMDMAIPFKSFEYLAYEIPAIVTTNTAIGDFTEKNGSGWVIPYNEDAVCELLNEVIRNPRLINEKRRNCAEAKRENLWICRAETVENDIL